MYDLKSLLNYVLSKLRKFDAFMLFIYINSKNLILIKFSRAEKIKSGSRDQ